MESKCKSRCIVGLMVLILVVALAGQAAAATRTWTGATDNDWYTTTNWNPNGSPVSSDDLTVDSGSPATTSSVWASNGGSITFNTLSASGSFEYLSIGNDGVGTLDIGNGADITSTTSYVGYNNGSMGTATVNGSGSTWNTGIYSIFTGYYGTGTLNITNGAGVTNSTAWIGYASGSTGNVTVDGFDSTWDTAGLYVGSTGTGTLNITNGADVTSDSGYVGSNTGSVGTVTLDGSGSTWDTGISTLNVGYYGTGTFNITNGADVTSGTGNIGFQAGSEGTVTVDGYSSTWNTGLYSIYVGTNDNATATLNVSNDAQVTTTNYLVIGAKGTVNLSGGKLSAGNLTGPADSLNFTGGELEITTGDVTISGSDPLGSYLSMGSGQILDVAGSTTVKAASTLNVNSGMVTTGTTLQNDGYLSLGNGGSITTATGLTNSSYMNMSGGTIGGAGKLTNDYGASCSAKGTVNTALDNYGTIDLDDVLTVAGAMDNYGSVYIYTSEMLRQNGGLDNYGTVDLDGGSIAGSGTVTNYAGGIIRGGSAIGSQLTNNGGLIHADGYSTLLISDMTGGNINGGEMRVDNDAGINVLTPFSNAGTVVLNGSDATFSGGTITNTGTISGQGWVSNSVTNSGTVRSSGGKLTLAGSGFTNNGTGRIEASEGFTVFVTQGLANNQGDITLLGGVFDNGNQTIENTGSITGYGTFRSDGLTNTNHIGIGLGDFEIIGAVVNNGNVYIESNSTAVFYDDVSGSGTFGGTGTAMFLGALSPGSSPGAMSFEGSVVLSSASTLEMELGGMLPGNYDVIDVAGDLALDGILDVVLIDGFEPDIGNIFDILDFNPANLLGTFDTINLPELSGMLAWDTSPLYTIGQISVVPEPATVALLGLGALGLLHRRKK